MRRRGGRTARAMRRLGGRVPGEERGRAALVVVEQDEAPRVRPIARPQLQQLAPGAHTLQAVFDYRVHVYECYVYVCRGGGGEETGSRKTSHTYGWKWKLIIGLAAVKRCSLLFSVLFCPAGTYCTLYSILVCVPCRTWLCGGTASTLLDSTLQ